MADEKEMIISVALSTFFGGATSSLAAIRRKVTVGQALVATAFGCLVSASIPFAMMALGFHWAISIPCAVVAGMLIFGILAWADVQETKLPKVDIRDILKNRFGRPPEARSPDTDSLNGMPNKFSDPKPDSKSGGSSS